MQGLLLVTGFSLWEASPRKLGCKWDCPGSTLGSEGSAWAVHDAARTDTASPFLLKKAQKGFTSIFLLLLYFVVVVIGLFNFFLIENRF